MKKMRWFCILSLVITWFIPFIGIHLRPGGAELMEYFYFPPISILFVGNLISYLGLIYILPSLIYALLLFFLSKAFRPVRMAALGLQLLFFGAIFVFLVLPGATWQAILLCLLTLLLSLFPVLIEILWWNKQPTLQHDMTLHPAPFAAVASGQKTIELRLYDEKRRKIRPGDLLRFTNTENEAETLLARVVALHIFPTFKELYAALPLLSCGYTKETLEAADPVDMEAYYSKEKQAQYQVVGIELSLLTDTTGIGDIE